MASLCPALSPLQGRKEEKRESAHASRNESDLQKIEEPGVHEFLSARARLLLLVVVVVAVVACIGSMVVRVGTWWGARYPSWIALDWGTAWTASCALAAVACPWRLFFSFS